MKHTFFEELKIFKIFSYYEKLKVLKSFYLRVGGVSWPPLK